MYFNSIYFCTSIYSKFFNKLDFKISLIVLLSLNIHDVIYFETIKWRKKDTSCKKTLCKIRLPVKNNFFIKVIHSILNIQ